ncbi:MAG: hypothetical protein HOV80_10430 [Polyangiaceae bacterium]|nr:hypothetical protein [Polyangiaceae bacterium]
MVTVYVVAVLAVLGILWLLRSRGSDVEEMPRPSSPKPPPREEDDGD